MKIYLDQIFGQKLKWIKFPNYSTFFYFITKFLLVIDSVGATKICKTET